MACTDKPLLALVGGVGAGKTTFACRWLLNKISLKPKGTFWFCSKQSSTLDVCFRLFESLLIQTGYEENYHYTLKRSSGSQEVNFTSGAIVRFKSAAAWQSWVSDSVDDAVGDEPGDWDRNAHKWLAERMRGLKAKPGDPIRQILYTGVPQGQTMFMEMFSGSKMKSSGLKFNWREFSFDLLKVAEDRMVLHFPTFFNTKIDLEQYIRRLLDIYGSSPEFVKAHILGQFCPLFENTVYKFSNRNIQRLSLDDFGDIEHLGLSFDFNVDRMAWTGYVQRAGKEFVVAEAKRGEQSTDTACDDIIVKFPPSRYRNLEICVDGDASGHSRDTRGHSSDYNIIVARLAPHYANVWVRAPKSNGSQRATIIAANRVIAPNKYLKTERRLIVGEHCENTTFGLQNTVFEKSKIKKTGGDEDWFTDFSDTVRYRIAAQFPIDDMYKQ